MEPHGHRESGRAASEMQVEQDEVGIRVFGCGNGTVGIGGRSHDPVARIVLDQIFERFRQLLVVLDHQDPEHRESPRTHGNSHREKSAENP